MTDKKMPEPMDSGAPERAVGEAASTNQRACYAAKTLIAEVLELFPETQHEIKEFNGRNVGLTVSFPDPEDELGDLLRLTVADARVNHVHTRSGGDDSVDVVFHNRPRTYDLRDSFGLDEAWMVLGEEEFDTDEEFAPLDGARLDYGSDSPPVEGGTASHTSSDKMDGGGA